MFSAEMNGAGRHRRTIARGCAKIRASERPGPASSPRVVRLPALLLEPVLAHRPRVELPAAPHHRANGSVGNERPRDADQPHDEKSHSPILEDSPAGCKQTVESRGLPSLLPRSLKVYPLLTYRCVSSSSGRLLKASCLQPMSAANDTRPPSAFEGAGAWRGRVQRTRAPRSLSLPSALCPPPSALSPTSIQLLPVPRSR